MDPIIIVIGIAAFLISLFVLSKIFSAKSAKYKKRSLAEISSGYQNPDIDDLDVISEEKDDLITEKTQDTPVIGVISRKLIISGTGIGLFHYIFILIIVAVSIAFVTGLALQDNWLIGGIVGVVTALILGDMFLNYMIDKRNRAFLDNFPDAIDIIVRGVKSGQPLLATLKTIAESGEPPLNHEFQKVVDEVSYGRPLNEALYRMSSRIGLLDLNFFAVILSIQQETGGNLSEILSNLSDVIRKRKQLRLKVRALTAEGRLTSSIFAVIPFVQLAAVYFLSSGYLDPLFTTTTGNNLLIVAATLIATAIFVSRKMSNVKV